MTIGMPACMRGLSVVSISQVTPNTLSERDTDCTALFLCVCLIRYRKLLIKIHTKIMKRVILTLICTVAAFVATAQTGTALTENNPLNIKFQGYGNVGLIYCPDASGAGPTADFNVGALFGNHFYAGFETGFHSLISTGYLGGYSFRLFEGYIPLALNMKGYLTKTKVRPFVNVSLGGFIGVADLGGLNGFYCQAGAGVDVKRFSVGLGYSGLVKGGTASSLYFKLGIRFGGKK